MGGGWQKYFLSYQVMCNFTIEALLTGTPLIPFFLHCSILFLTLIPDNDLKFNFPESNIL